MVLSGKYEAYSEYKDSGISGLGKIPGHWEVMQLKRTIDGCVNGIWGTEPEKDGNNTVVLRVADFDRPKLSLQEAGYTYRKIEEKEKLTRKLKRGDLLLEKSGGGEKTLVGQVVLFDKEFEAVTSNFVAKMTPKSGFNSRFLNYVFSRFYSENINYCSIKQNTGIQNLDSSAYLAEKFGFPVEAEQEKIANFLDHETAKIDTLIEKQQQLIKLLKEKRQAVISHAVTKGLNPNAPMRDSGVEWLGEVPEHWDVVKLSYRYEVLLGKMLDDKKITGDYLGAYLRNTDVQWDRINTEDLPKMDFRPEEHRRYSVEAGDLIVCEGGEIGRSAIWENDDKCFYQKALHRLRPYNYSRDNSRFMFYVMFDAVHQERFSGGVAKATIAHLPAETFRQYKFAYPPYGEQVDISVFLDEMKDKFELLELSAQRQIDLLQERRTALISAAVTGKIDVRHFNPEGGQPSESPNINNKEVVA
ncbi:hypothetical protein A9Q99_05695 [Gammaproteobacteria bacterium 45_16_T64]|nr:hypothetical protein A9Q99_05695 [Gammaproteobacteria bacterium 45_16_T64]